MDSGNKRDPIENFGEMSLLGRMRKCKQHTKEMQGLVVTMKLQFVIGTTKEIQKSVSFI